MLTAIVFCLAGALVGSYPFGPLTRSTNDLGTQFVPLYGQLRDLLLGDAEGDLLFNWGSGLGVPFLPDYAIALGSPASLLVLAFPRDRMDLAAFVITTSHLALAAGAMTAYLRRIAAGPALVAAPMGAAYALCGWAIDDAAFIPMWMTGLIGLPLLAIAGELVIRGRRVGWAPLLVALVWFCNFYTAYMATIGAAILILVRLVVLAPAPREAGAAVGRLAVTVLTGVALVAPILVPVVRAAQTAQPSPPATFAAYPWSDVFVRFLPLTEGVGISPSVYVVTPVLLLALALPWHGGLPVRLRLSYPLALVLVVLSLQWGPTHAVWHGFDVPNGSPYRQAFVVSGLVVVLAWQAVAHRRPPASAMTAAVASLVLLALAARSSVLDTPGTWAVLALSAALTVGVTLTARTRLHAAVTVLLLAAVLVEGTATAVVTDQVRRPRLSNHPPWSSELTALREVTTAGDEWPERRTSPRVNLEPNNDPMLIGGQSTAYYSSAMPSATFQTLNALGVTWYGWGRSIVAVDDPGLMPLLGIGARAVAAGERGARLQTSPSVPLVTLRSQDDLPAHLPGGSPFRARNLLWGSPVYDVPVVAAQVPQSARSSSSRDRYVLSDVPDDDPLVLTARCDPGDLVQMYTPSLTGEARLGAETAVPALPRGYRRPGVRGAAGPVVLGVVPPSGEVRVEVRGEPSVVVPTEPIGCLDMVERDEALASLSRRPPEVVVGGHSMTATWQEPVDGVAVVTVARIPGWRCRAGTDGRWSTPSAAAGFLAVPLDGAATFSCSFRPAGLRLGLAAFVAALMALAAAAAAPRLLRSTARRPRRSR